MKQKKITLTIIAFIGMLALSGCSTSTQTPSTSPSIESAEISVGSYEVLPMTEKVTVDQKEVSIASKMIKVGDVLSDDRLAKPAEKFNEVEFTKLSESKRVKLIYTAPSIDTPVCSLQTSQLNGAAKKHKDVDFLMISADLPFAQFRFCHANSIENLKTLSDYNGLNWARNNGFLMTEYNLLTRAIIIVDANNVVKYVQYVPEVTDEAKLDNALAYLEQVELQS